jgi:hypothetical protein
VVVDKGKAAEIGSHEALLAQDGAYASLVAHQLLKQREQLDQDTQDVLHARVKPSASLSDK